MKAERAAQISLAVTVWEIIVIFAFKKVLFSMWVLILTLQFFVYISTWQVRFPSTLKFILYELKRMALGEFMDDLDLGGSIMSGLGLESGKTSSADEKVGEARLGATSPLESFGPTLLLGSMLFFLLIFIIVALLVIVKRTNPSPKCHERVAKLKKMVFFNPIIRYFFLNSLKLNMAGFIAFKAKGEPADLAIAICILVVTNGAPLAFYISLGRWRD